ncbi:MAG: hypothetical protein KIT31_29325 [Deltaproteobacteria bacterium]|nr:hypothetical protein [Deltaproteobacteria bacterium]
MPPTALHEIEAALAEHFDADHLAVYADLLQECGDPRGELIAADLADRTSDDAIAAWLGPSLAHLIAPEDVQAAFIDDVFLDGDSPRGRALLDQLSAHPALRYVRGATVRGDAAWVATVVAELGLQRQRWLERLSIQVTDGGGGAIGDAAAARLTAATPRLVALEVWGRRVFGELAHPTLRSLRITGHDAVGSILGAGPARLPALGLLDLAFDGDDFNDAVLAARYRPERLPALRRLDLSRNEPGHRAPHYFGGTADAYEVLARSPLRTRLADARLPSLRRWRQGEALERLVAAGPRSIEIARAYACFQGIVVTPLGVRTPARTFPWRPLDQTQPALVTWLPDLGGEQGRRRYELPLAPLAEWLELEVAEHPRLLRWCSLVGYLLDDPGPRGVAVLHDAAALADLRASLPPGDDLAPWARFLDALGRATPLLASDGVLWRM